MTRCFTLICFLVLNVAGLVPTATAAGLPTGGLPVSEPQFLPVDEAFALGVDVVDVEGGEREVTAFWQNADGYYLYRHRFGFALLNAGGAKPFDVRIPDGLQKTDEYFGDVEVYYGNATLRTRLPAGLPPTAVLRIDFQGCADAGLCYPPESRFLRVSEGSAGVLSAVAPAAAPIESGADEEAPAEIETPATQDGAIAALLGERFLIALGVLFLAGIGLAFTPCVLPMVPILSSIIAGEGDVTRGRAALLSAVYVLSMALTYAVLGAIVGTFGGALNLHGWLQSPVVLVAFAILFAGLSLSMFGYYELQLPAALRDRLSGRGSGGGLGGVAIMGFFSSLVVSPCVSAPLVGVLAYISTTGDGLVGFLALFALALGMGVPLMVVGVGGGSLLPRAGAWMDHVKAVFGVLLLAVAVWLLERVVPGPVTLVLWGTLAIGSAVALGALDLQPRQGIGVVWKALGFLLLVIGIVLVVGAARGASDPLRPLAGGNVSAAPQQGYEFIAVDDLEEIDQQFEVARAAGRPVMLDLYADWCISCKIMEREVFPDPAVAPLLARFHLLRADVTENSPAHRELLGHYGLFGPPAMLFFDAEGRERTALRKQGEMDAEPFAALLQRALAAR